MRKLSTLLATLFICTISLTAQYDPAYEVRDSTTGQQLAAEEVYRVNPLLEGTTALAGLGATIYFFQVINDKEIMDASTVNREDVPGIDRWAFPENVDRVDEIEASSDIPFFGGIVLPFTLFFDKEIRKDWLDITTLYVQAAAVNGVLYAISPIGPNFIDRNRPIAYYPELNGGEIDGGDQNSWYSGHTSTTATGSFFFAKVLSDYHPEWSGGKRALLFGLAALPPAFVAVQRTRALKHFPTDNAMGYLVGAATGILVPHIHKRWAAKHRSRLSLRGGYGQGAAVAGFGLVF